MNVHRVTSDHGTSHAIKGPGAVVNALRGTKKYVGEVSLHIQLQLNTAVFLSVPTDKNVKDLFLTNLGLYLKTICFRTYIDRKLFLVLVGRIP
jgi:hypothetical protein